MNAVLANPDVRREPPELRLERVGVAIGRTWLFRALDLVLRPGEWLALLGPSGSGKTTLVRVVAGLVEASEGMALIAGRPWRALRGAERVALRRGFGYVQQQPGLLHATALDNVATPLRWRGWERSEALAAARESLAQVRLDSIASKGALGLSGGERQRVAFARAIAGEPRVLLLDEFTNHQDPGHADLLESLVAERLRAGASAVVVAHDLAEIDRIREKSDRDPAVGILLGGTWCAVPWQSMPGRTFDRDGIGSFLRRFPGPALPSTRSGGASPGTGSAPLRTDPDAR